MKTTKLLLILGVLCFMTLQLHSQVTVGLDEAPAKGALLDLKSQSSDAENVTSETGGLVLPRVKLVDMATLEPFIATTDPDWVDNETTHIKAQHAGLIVHNLNATTPFSVGLYLWDGTKWTTTNYTGSTSVILNNSSFERAALTGDVTANANSNVTTIADNAVTSAKIANSAVTDVKLDQMGANNNNVLTWSDTANKWVPRGADFLLPPPSGGSVSEFELTVIGNTVTGETTLSHGIWLLTGVLSYDNNSNIEGNIFMNGSDGTLSSYSTIYRNGNERDILFFGAVHVTSSTQNWSGTLIDAGGVEEFIVHAVKLSDL